MLSVDVAALDALLPQAARLKVIAAAKVNANVFFIMVLLLLYVGMLISLPLIVFMVKQNRRKSKVHFD